MITCASAAADPGFSTGMAPTQKVEGGGQTIIWPNFAEDEDANVDPPLFS